MAYPILGTPKPAFFDSSGSPLASGTITTLDPDDDTVKASYPTLADADAATNGTSGDITLDSRGEPTSTQYWGADGEDYKVVIKDSAGATIYTIADLIVPSQDLTLYGPTAQTLTDAGAVTLTESTTFIVTTGAAAITLADGVENQKKIIVMKTDAGAATLTPANFANGTTVVFNDVGDSADLVFANSSWHWLGGSAIVTGVVGTTTAFTSSDTTPTVNGGEGFLTAGTTAITDFDDGVVGQTIRILATLGITITNGSPISLLGLKNFDMALGDSLTLHMFNDQVWEEIARTTASLAKLSEVVTGANVISAQETGKTFYLDLAGGFTSTLPSPAIGLNYKFIVKTQPTTAYIVTTTSGDNVLFGTLLDIVGEQVYYASQDTVNFVASTSVVGDSLEVESDGTNWYCTAISGADGGITTAA